ncbi:hypothetical protein EH244_30500 [Variovorax beijingensis]|uniref:Uncharacterized protein n=1 Tax=Variovorax beijingensis TaxID=2496117 RepID=A0A3P3E246_9BURK|nr:hypothetical protein [Variovorax beijingensis]RRH80481.1 hypothetical protein EH244_30500 [Variovorax beijingensis]
MTRYLGQVVKVLDPFTVVVNIGTDQGVKPDSKFLIVGLADLIVDPTTGKELERLEIVRGKVGVQHVQPSIATLRSIEWDRSPDSREIKKVTGRGAGGLSNIFGNQDTVTELITPGDEKLRPLSEIQVGDHVLRA